MASIAQIRDALRQEDRSNYQSIEFIKRHSCGDASCKSNFCPMCRPILKRQMAERWTTDFTRPDECFFPTILFDDRRATPSKEQAVEIVKELLQTAGRVAKECKIAIRLVPEVKSLITNGQRLFFPHAHGIGQAHNEQDGRNFDKAIRKALGKNKAVLLMQVSLERGGVAGVARYANKGQTDWLVELPSGREVYDQTQPIDSEIISFFKDALTGLEVVVGNPMSKLKAILDKKRVAQVQASAVLSSVGQGIGKAPSGVGGTSSIADNTVMGLLAYKQMLVTTDHLSRTNRIVMARATLEQIKASRHQLSN